MPFLPSRETQVTHIGEMKMQFLPSRETNVLGTFLWVWLFSSVWDPEFRFFTSCKTHVPWGPRLLLRYFLHSAVCKCDLCLLTGTGWYFEGNWTVCWRILVYSLRKLDGLLMETVRSNDGNWTDYWRKLDVLLKETGRCIEGNWMVWIRKLDGLLTVTGWWIDGNWTFYWWKQWSLLMEAVQRIFLI